MVPSRYHSCISLTQLVLNRETDGETAARLERARIAEERLKKPGARKEKRDDARWAAYDEINRQVETQEQKMAAAGRAQLIAEGILPASSALPMPPRVAASSAPSSANASPATTPQTVTRSLPPTTAATPAKAISPTPTPSARPAAPHVSRAVSAPGADDRDLRAAAIAVRVTLTRHAFLAI